MHGPTTGAPLRVISTMMALWIATRLIWSTIPVDAEADSAASVHSKTGYRNTLNAHQAGVPLANARLPVPAMSQKTTGQIHPMAMLSIYPAGNAFEPTGPEWPESLSRLSFALTDPQISVGGLVAGDVPANSRDSVGKMEPITSLSTFFAGERRGLRTAGYFWIFSRQDVGDMASTMRRSGGIVSNGRYGGSQMGAILSIPLSSRAADDLALYGRFSAALTPFSQEEIALGAKIRPVQSLPFAIHAEQRLSADSGGDRGTAFYITGGTGPDQLIDKIAVETYAQAGYVLGKNHTHFYDGSATLLRPIGGIARTRLSVGAGLWAGGQRKIARLDIGPRADITVPIGTGSARIAMDWRVRVAGNARPGTGAAITVSTGF